MIGWLWHGGVWGQSISVVDLQRFRTTMVMDIVEGSHAGSVALVNLNPQVNAWYLLMFNQADSNSVSYHLENPYPKQQRLILNPKHPDGVVLVNGRDSVYCDLWDKLDRAHKTRQPYVALCDGRLLLRNKTEGHKTSREWAADFLRMYVPGGEKITTFVRSTFYKDAFLSMLEISPTNQAKGRARPAGAPARPLMEETDEGSSVLPKDLGIALEETDQGRILIGWWYRAVGLPGIFVSAMQPKMVASSVLEAQKSLVKPLDDVENKAMVFLIAFDLAQFDVGFALGTEHPRVDWSDRSTMRDPHLPGPDGIGSIDPLVNTGMLNPVYGDLVAATFTGGFKRYHGAFRRSRLATVNYGSHYGFIENGVVMSTLQPGLATAVMYLDGTLDLKTWALRDTADLKRIRHARQNGAPLIEWDDLTRSPKPGNLVGRPALGNWSGAVDGSYRTLRAGIGLQEMGGHRFLVYGYFSAATPSAMARVFQAYGCRYAMATDMNALEHTYLAVYTKKEGRLIPQHLVKGMEVLDKVSQDQVVPRFVGYADNRDFFYVFRKGLP